MSHYTESFNRLVMNTRNTLLLISFVVLNFLFLSINQNLRAALTSRPLLVSFSLFTANHILMLLNISHLFLFLRITVLIRPLSYYQKLA